MNDMKKEPVLSIIVAMTQNGVIGANGAMPWRLPSDLQYFKQVTMHKPIIMGSKTWGSLNKRPLPQRANIVMTRQKTGLLEGAYSVASIGEAVSLAKDEVQKNNLNEIFFIGGGDVFKQALPFIDRIYITEILADIKGDTYFHLPSDIKNWHKQIIDGPKKQQQDSHDFRFVVYEK